MTDMRQSISTDPLILWSIVAFAVAMLCSFVLTPCVKRIAFYCGAVDYPNSRKVHTSPTARFGGIAIVGSFIISLGGLWLLTPGHLVMVWTSPLQGSGFCFGILAVFILGVRDDMHCVPAKIKLMVQILAGIAVVCAGFSFCSNLQYPDLSRPVLSIADCILTVLWIVAVTNAVNLVDGLDGLASGVSIIACLTMFPFALWNRDPGMGFLTLTLAGALLGFLFHNFNPARIFMGDSGSLVVGFLLSILSIKCAAPVRNGFGALIPLVVLGFPMLDTVLSIMRRLLRSLRLDPPAGGGFIGRLELIFSPDKNHIHHKLIESGFSQRKAVLFLYGISCVLGMVALALAHASPEFAWSGALIFIVAVWTAVRRLGYKELAVIRNGLLLKMFDYVFNHRKHLILLDVVFIMISLATSYAFQVQAGVSLGFMQVLCCFTAVVIIQSGVLWITGLYEHKSRYPDVESLYGFLRGIALAIIVTGAVLALAPLPGTRSTPILLLTDFYLLATLVCTSRYSLRSLARAFRSPANGASRVLLYGTGLNAQFLLESLFNDTARSVVPIGFIDDNPELEGSKVYGYPVFGGHRKLAGLIDELGVDRIYLVNEDVQPEALDKLRESARKQGVRLMKFSTHLEEIVSAGRGLPAAVSPFDLNVVAR